MRIKHLKVENYKGIRELDWEFSNRMICLIGPGDSTKSTILDAIEIVLWPSWHLLINDSDFYQGDINNTIKIEVTITDLPIELLADDKYGLYLRGNIYINNDDPIDGNDYCLTIRLTINDTLEPEWRVVNNRSEGKIISYKDREKLCVSRVGVIFDKDFTLSKNSVLNRVSSQLTGLNDMLLSTARNVCTTTDLSGDCFPDLMEEMNISAKEYGVKPKIGFKAKVDIKSFNMGVSAISVHDGNVPLRLFGLGTRRLISMGLNMGCSSIGAVVLVDEIENGLEPYRLRNVLKKLRDVVKEQGQVILTSHSPITIVELTADNIVVVRAINGKTECKQIQDSLQATIRSVPEAILSPKVIVCEGKTEYGICRALDETEKVIRRESFAYAGVSYVEGGGSEAYKRAKELKNLGYEVALFIDSDVEDINKEADKLTTLGIEVIRWKNRVSTDEQIFFDLPWEAFQKLIDVAVEFKGEESVLSSLKAQLGTKWTIDSLEIDKWAIEEKDQNEIRVILGKVAKKKEWYKRVDQGEKIGHIAIEYCNKKGENKDFVRVFNALKEWIYGTSFNK